MNGHKITGVIIATVLVLLAVLAFTLSRCKVVKKDVTAGTTKPQQSIQQTVTGQQTVSQQIQQSQVQQTQTVQPTQPVTTKQADSLVEANDASKFASAKEQSTYGVLQDKKSYMQDSQLLYCLEIYVPTDEGFVAKYYCSGEVYNSIEKGSLLNVTYKQAGDGTVAIVSVSK